MAKMLKDEMSVIKSVMVEIDPDTVVLVTDQYHTEKNDLGKVDRSKSEYRWLARVMTKAEVKKMIDWCYADENRLNRWRWPNDKSKFYVAPADSQNSKVGNWLENKLKKIRTWDYGMKVFKGWETQTAKRQEGYNPAAAYVVDGYVADNGDIVSITDREALLKHVGQNLLAPHLMKSKLPPVTAKKPIA